MYPGLTLAILLALSCGLGVVDAVSSVSYSPRYTDVYQKSSRHTQLRRERLPDQLLYHAIRSFELDLYHDDMGVDFSLYDAEAQTVTTIWDLSEAVNLIQAFQRIHPRHEVVTVWINFQDSLDDDKHTIELFDSLISVLPLYRPQDLVDSCTEPVCDGEHSIRTANFATGWPRLAELRGRVIFIVAEGHQSYCGPEYYSMAPNCNGRAAFIAKTADHTTDALHPGRNIAAFNQPWDRGSVGPAIHEYDYTSRVYSAGPGIKTATEWQQAKDWHYGHLATDRVNMHTNRRMTTHNQLGYPFQWMDEDATYQKEVGIEYIHFYASMTSPQARPSDGVAFAYRTPPTEFASTWTHWTTNVAMSGDCFHFNSLGGIMLRRGATDTEPTLDSETVYVSFIRHCNLGGLYINYRKEYGGETMLNPILRPSHASIRLSSKVVPNQKNEAQLDTHIRAYVLPIEGGDWEEVDKLVFEDTIFPFQGLVASSGIAKANDDGTMVKILFAQTSYNGEPVRAVDLPGQAVITEDGTGSFVVGQGFAAQHEPSGDNINAARESGIDAVMVLVASCLSIVWTRLVTC